MAKPFLWTAAVVCLALAAERSPAATLQLSADIQHRLGIVTQQVTVSRQSTEIDAFAKVLDPAPLVQTDSDLATAEAAAAASSAEAKRSQALHAADGSIAAKDVEAAVSQARQDALKVALLRRQLALTWGPGVARLSDGARGRLVRALAAGAAALVHVDTHNNDGQAGARFVKVDIGDGSARGAVIGPARAAEPRLQSSGLIVEITGPQAMLLSVGLTQSAHIESSTPQSGVMLPRAAVVRFRGSDWVYVRSGPTAFDRRLVQSPVVEADGLFVAQGFADGDQVVTEGAQALFAAEQNGPRGPSAMLGRVVRWSLERPRLIAWACVWFLAWGAFFMRDAKVELMPDLAPAETRIQTEAPGLVAEQVETLVTQPLENSLIGAAGVAKVTSESTQGLSTITVRFADGADPYRVRQALAENLAAAASALPDGVAPPRLAPLAAPGADVLKLGFTSAKLDPMGLRDLVQWTVRPRLLSAAGVARVAVYGGQIRRIEVRARPGDLSDSDLGFLDILNAVKRATSVAGAGFIDTDGQRVLIEPHGQALTADDVGAGQIQTPGSTPVRIADVSDVVEAPAPAFGDALIDGKPGVLVEVARQYGANTASATHAAERALLALAPTLAAQGVKVVILDRPASFTTLAMRGIALDLAVGAGLIALALALFMRDWRAVLVSLVSIPVSLLAAVVVLKAFGWTLNSMTLGGLAVGLGVVIDDAVIGVENVVARVRQAEHDHSSDLEAVLAATLEVRGPVVYATVAAIAALAPLLALRGVQGALLAPLAAAVIAISLASLVVATLLTPALGLLFHHHEAPPAEPRLLERVKRVHGRWLGRLCGNAGLVTLLAAASVVLVVGALVFCRSELLPSVRDGHLVAEVGAPPSTSLAVMRDYGIRISGELKALPGVTAVAQRVGRDASGDDSAGPERAVFDLDLAPSLGASAQADVARRVETDLALHPGLQPLVRSRFDAGQQGYEPAAPLRVSLFGQDLDALDTTAEQTAAVLRSMPGAGRVPAPDEARAPVVRVDLNFPRLALYGLSSADVLDTVQAAFAGERVAQIYEGGRVVDLAVSAQASLRQDPEAVGDLLLRSTSGFSEPLKTVANVYLTDGRATIAHDGGLRRQVVTADPADPERFVAAARAAMAQRVALPPGAFVEVTSDAQAVAAAQRDLMIDYGFVLFAILALLAVAYDARTAALIIASSLFSFVGAALAVFAMGGVLTAGAIAGFVALFGLSMRSGILVFTRLEDVVLTERATWTAETVIGVVRDRMTPLLMTSLLVALALAPFALQAGDAGRELLAPMAIVIMAGLVAGALGALFVLPAMILTFWRPAYARRARRHGHA